MIPGSGLSEAVVADSVVVEPAAAYCSSDLERIFAECFFAEYRTRLCGGAKEPLYQPAIGTGDCATLYYREDFFASALHEIAHWCIAGEQRRSLVDFGYWYAPEGRSEEEQQRFEAVEAAPQGLEWLFSLACGTGFRVSIDDFSQTSAARRQDFESCVLGRARRWQSEGLPHRASVFFRALAGFFGTPGDPAMHTLSLEEMRR